MADRYWLGTVGPDPTDANNWSTSSGGSGGASVPGASDKAILNGGGMVVSVSPTNIDESTNRITSSGHPFSTDMGVWVTGPCETSTTVLPSPLLEFTTYYINKVDANTIELCATAPGSGGSAIDLTNKGSGSFKIRLASPPLFNAPITLGELDIQNTMAGITAFDGVQINIANNLTLNNQIQAANTQINFTGNAASGMGTHMIKNGRYAKIIDPEELTYNMSCTQNPTTFDDGPYPIVYLSGEASTAVNFSPEASTAVTSEVFDHYDNGKATFYALNIVHRASNTPTFQPNSSSSNELNDGAKEFKITNAFTCTLAEFNGGHATWDFPASSAGFLLPHNNASTYGGDVPFKSKIKKIKVHAATAGHKVTMEQHGVIRCESLEIGDGCILRGPVQTDSYGAEIHCVKPPIVSGSWNFSQVTPGIYRTPITHTVEMEPHTAHISLSSSVTGFASGAYTIAPLDTADVDTASAWDNTNRCWVVPRDGKYLVSYSIGIRYISSSHLAIANLYKQSGGSGTFSGSTVSRATYGRDSGEPSGGTILLDCVANDRIALYAYHNGGSGKNLLGDSVTEGITFLSIMEVL